MQYRIEQDSLGEVKVPANRLYAAQTARSLHNFQIGTEIMPLGVMKALVLLKLSAAKVNEERHFIPAEIGKAIQIAGKLILHNFAEFKAEFPLHVWQTGSGTQSNMNANEVLANLATVILTAQNDAKAKGENLNTEQLEAAVLSIVGTDQVTETLNRASLRVHPNDHVNCSQSSNDTFPTAMHILAYIKVLELEQGLDRLIKAFDPLILENMETFKSARTHLQDAVPMSFAQELSGWQHLVIEGRTILAQNAEQLLNVALGGTACGTGLNTPDNFSEAVLDEVNQTLSVAHADLTKIASFAFRKNVNLFAALSGKSAVAACHGALAVLAGNLFKMANDIRYLASGPRLGYGEITIPANEPGSSIMPGKVNPTQAEALTMVAIQVMANNQAITFANSQGQFQLNVFMPLIVHNFEKSASLLLEAVDSFKEHLLAGIKATKAKMLANFQNSLMNVTALSPKLGYKQAAKLANEANDEGLTLWEVVDKHKLLSRAEFDALLDPKKLSYPHGEKI